METTIEKPSAAANASDKADSPAMSGSGVALPPTQIWLQWDGDGEPSDMPIEKRGEVCWCQDKIFDGDYEYVRLPREESLSKLMRWIAGRDGKNGATTATMIHRKLLAMGLEHQNDPAHRPVLKQD